MMTGIRVALCLAAVLIILLIFNEIFDMKNECTYKNQMKILRAVTRYKCYMIELGMNPEKLPVQYEDIEDYGKTLWRWWDWGCTRILPFDKYIIIKPFIKEE